MKIDGACHCGYIRVEGEADPEKTTVCHCTDCQVSTGSAFRVNVPVPGATFRITGQPATYLKTTAESGNPPHASSWRRRKRKAQAQAERVSLGGYARANPRRRD